MSREFKSVTATETLRDVLWKISHSTVGMVIEIGQDNRFSRTITDGDVRRALVNGLDLDALVSELTPISSATLPAGSTPKAITDLMDKCKIDQVPLVGDDGIVVEVVHRRDIARPILLSTPHLGEDELDFVREAFATNWIAPLGPNVDGFEADIATMVGTSAACAVSSGTAAIHLALHLVGVQPGDVVFVSDFTFVATVNPVLYLGATPVFIDSDYETWNMSPLALARAFEAAKAAGTLPKAVVAVNLYGQSADYDPLLEICNSYGVPLIEDAAESLGATYKGRASGTLGKIGCYSFNGNKIITTSGGGMLVADDPELMARARYLATQARQPVPFYQHMEAGYNYRMSNILAGVGRGQVRVLDERIARRRAINELYRAGFADLEVVNFMPEPEWSFSNRWLSSAVIGEPHSSPDIDKIVRDINDHMVEVRHLWKPMHVQPMFDSAKNYETGNTSVASDLFARGFCLPSGSNMSDDQVAQVIDVVRACLDRHQV